MLLTLSYIQQKILAETTMSFKITCIRKETVNIFVAVRIGFVVCVLNVSTVWTIRSVTREAISEGYSSEEKDPLSVMRIECIRSSGCLIQRWPASVILVFHGSYWIEVLSLCASLKSPGARSLKSRSLLFSDWVVANKSITNARIGIVPHSLATATARPLACCAALSC